MGYKNKRKFKKRQVVEVVSESHQTRGNKTRDPAEMPNTFKFAAEALKIMSERGGSAGSIVVGKYKSYNFKLIYALVMNTAKNIKIIKKIIHNLKLIKHIQEDNPFMLEILVGDLLFGKGLKSVEKNPVAASIISRKAEILKEQASLKDEFKASDRDEVTAKYLRVNYLKADLANVISQLKVVGLEKLEYSKDKIKFKKFINKFKTMEEGQYMMDFHFPNDLILVKQAGADRLKKTDLFNKKKVTLQDKASFMAIEALDPKPSEKIIDACFAPGCKTSLIAARMKNKGKILAYDINKKRLVDAVRFLKLQGATCVKAELQDFSKVKLKRLLKINNIDSFDSILLDPSCSGSGIRARVDYKKSDEEAGRLKKLQAFQVSLLKHALKARVSKTIVYCTCSTSVEENEQVLEMALKESGVKDNWEFVEVIPYWPQRGDESFEFGQKCVRSDAGCLTNGFFIAKLKCKDAQCESNNGQALVSPNGTNGAPDKAADSDEASASGDDSEPDLGERDGEEDMEDEEDEEDEEEGEDEEDDEDEEDEEVESYETPESAIDSDEGSASADDSDS